MLKRENPNHKRKPLVSEGDSRCPQFAELYWQGGRNAAWAELVSEVAGLHDVGILTGQSGLVVLDCDVKHYEAKTDFEVDNNTAQLVTVEESHTEYGMRDLEREVLKLGHTMDELATYTVKSKSDGRHLYFWQNPELVIPSQVQRHRWHVDVKASENTWVAAPPSAGYEVLDDREVAVLPLWLAQFLAEIKRHLEPIGGRRTRALNQKAREAMTAVFSADPEERDSHLSTWTSWELQRVADAQKLDRGWNNAIFDTAANLFDGGWGKNDVIAMIRKVAQPRDKRNANLMLDTINSAARKTGAR
ncbi:bifunctional DNA primase/polymerase [Streptomyces sp. NPDC004232]|uniref:bifunctional DNA primase/polymerase n=1 Tax=Streptomyces sp. NPDC004232 TaxID=3154454 RepID=UPI0033A5106B